MHERVVEFRMGDERRLRVAVISGIAGQMLQSQGAGIVVSASALERGVNLFLESVPAETEIVEIVPWGAAVVILYRAAPVAPAEESEASASTEREVAGPSSVLIVPRTARVS